MTYALTSSSLSSFSSSSTSSANSANALSFFSTEKMNEMAKKEIWEKAPKDRGVTTSSMPHAIRLPSPIVNKIITYLGDNEKNLMSPVFWMMSGDKSDLQNFYKIMSERIFPKETQKHNDYAWKDHYYRCLDSWTNHQRVHAYVLAYKRGYEYTKRTVTFLKDSTLFISRVFAPIAIIKATSYFGEQFFFSQESKITQKDDFFHTHSAPVYSSLDGTMTIFRAPHYFETTCPNYVSSKSIYKSTTPYYFELKTDNSDDVMTMEGINRMARSLFYPTMLTDNYLIDSISGFTGLFGLGWTMFSNLFNREEEYTPIKNFLKFALSSISGVFLSSFLYGKPVDLVSEVKNITTYLIPVLALTCILPTIQREVRFQLRNHRIPRLITDIIDFSIKPLLKTVLFTLLFPTDLLGKRDYDNLLNNRKDPNAGRSTLDLSSDFVGTNILMGAFLGGGIYSLPISVMPAIFSASFLAAEGATTTPQLISEECYVSSPVLADLNRKLSNKSIFSGCLISGLLCSSPVTKLAEKVSNCVGFFLAPIVGTFCVAAKAINNGHCYSYVSQKARRIYNWVRNR